MSEVAKHDAWSAGDSYDAYMGRWSRRIAPRFLDWLDAPAGLDWLEIGCGTGALSAAILTQCMPKSLLSIDPSEGFLAKARSAVRDERVALFEGICVEQQDDAFACGQFPRFSLPPKPLLTPAGLGLASHVRQLRQRIRCVRRHTLAAWAFSQSFRNRSSPRSVSGWLNICSMTLPGQVHTSAPMRAASTMCCGPRTLATSTSVV